VRRDRRVSTLRIASNILNRARAASSKGIDSSRPGRSSRTSGTMSAISLARGPASFRSSVPSGSRRTERITWTHGQ
jgi:hypothetical protein